MSWFEQVSDNSTQSWPHCAHNWQLVKGTGTMFDAVARSYRAGRPLLPFRDVRSPSFQLLAQDHHASGTLKLYVNVGQHAVKQRKTGGQLARYFMYLTLANLEFKGTVLHRHSSSSKRNLFLMMIDRWRGKQLGAFLEVAVVVVGGRSDGRC